MAADREIMKALETLRLDRPGRVHDVAKQGLQSESLGAQLIETLRELAATFREEAELWTRSGARGWKSSEAEAYLIAQAVDEVAGQLDNAGGGAALSVSTRESVGQTEAATTHERLDDLVNAAVAEGRGMLRDVPSTDLNDIMARHGDASDVAAYLSGEVDTLPGLADALVPGSVTDATHTFTIAPEATMTLTVEQLPFGHVFSDNADCVACTICSEACLSANPCTCCRTSALMPSSVTSAPETDDPFAKPYCRDCDYDTHRCYGCGEPVDHGRYACAQCEIIHADGPPVAVPKTWESDTLTADGHMKPGVAQTLAPALGQPGDMGAGYSHDYVPPGGRRVTFAELLTPVPAASLPPHLSHSQGNTIGDCATKYRLQRIEALPQIPQWANIGGTAFHAAVEAFERTVAKMAPGSTVGADWKSYDCEVTWKHHFEGQISAVQATTTVPISMWRAARKGAEGRAWWEVNGPLMLRRYLDARPAEPTSHLPAMVASENGSPFQLAIELELTADVPTPYGPLPYTAILDRVTNAPQPGPDSPESNWITLVIRDYKTSYERPTDTTQLGDYAHVLRLWGVPESVRILGTFFDARRGEWTEPVDLLQAHPFEAFQYNATSRHAQKHALTTGPTPARPSSFCGGCSVRYACPIMASKS